MKNPDVALFLLHIVEACEKIQTYLNGLSQSDFMQNQMVQDAILRNFEIIGEAAKHVPEEFRQKYPQINWRGMAGLRDILIHEYFGIDFVNIWNISRKDLPGTCAEVKKIPEYAAAQAVLKRFSRP